MDLTKFLGQDTQEPSAQRLSKEEYAAQKKQEREEIWGMIDGKAQEIFQNGDSLKGFLDFMGQCKPQRTDNLFLLYAQNPEIRQIKTFEKWKEEGKVVKTGSKGYNFIVGQEYEKDGVIQQGYSIQKAYDISQIRTKQPEEAEPKPMDQLMEALLTDSEVRIQIADNLPDKVQAQYIPNQRTIYVRNGMSENTTFHSISRELAYASLDHHDGSYSRAGVEEYVPFLSDVLLKADLLQGELKAVVRKGKEHFVCDYRLAQRLEAVRDKNKNQAQMEALKSLRHNFDLDSVHNLSGFDRRLVCVPKFCPRECPGKAGCRYQKHLDISRKEDIFLQICNHNYLLADAMHRANGYRPLLADYRALVVDEAHKLPEAASQMYGRSIGREDVQEIAYFLGREHKGTDGKRLMEGFSALQAEIRKHRKDGTEDMAGKESFYFPPGAGTALAQMQERLQLMIKRLAGNIPYWTFRRLEEMEELFGWFLKNDKRYILFLQQDSRGHLTFMAVNREIPKYLDATLWSRGFPAILTSGTLKAGNGFARTRQMTGLEKETGVRECVAESPFCYKENCLLYIPEHLRPMKKGSREEAEQLAGQIRDLVCSTYGHTLVLFTSYTLMGNVHQLLRDQIPFPMVQVWRNSQEEIARFKKMENAVLFAAGSCWEGVDFPGDMVSSLIIVKLPFSVPDPIHEAQKEQYRSLESYIQTIVVPDMQKKLRQGFGRAIRTEQDTCVVSILDHRTAKKGRYRSDVLEALPKCQMAERIEEVEDFIRSRKVERYYS